MRWDVCHGACSSEHHQRARRWPPETERCRRITLNAQAAQTAWGFVRAFALRREREGAGNVFYLFCTSGLLCHFPPRHILQWRELRGDEGVRRAMSVDCFQGWTTREWIEMIRIYGSGGIFFLFSINADAPPHAEGAYVGLGAVNNERNRYKPNRKFNLKALSPSGSLRAPHEPS